MPQFDDLSDPCSVPEASDATGIPESTLYRYLRAGDGPAHYRICGLIRIDKRELCEWFEAHRRETGEGAA